MSLAFDYFYEIIYEKYQCFQRLHMKRVHPYSSYSKNDIIYSKYIYIRNKKLKLIFNPHH